MRKKRSQPGKSSGRGYGLPFVLSDFIMIIFYLLLLLSLSLSSPEGVVVQIGGLYISIQDGWISYAFIYSAHPFLILILIFSVCSSAVCYLLQDFYMVEKNKQN